MVRGPLGLLALLMMLSACTVSRTAPSTPVEERTVETEVREPARQDSAGVQVAPLRNPAVVQLSDQAAAAEQAGEHDRAAGLLERALRIQPRSPEVLQQMAEVQLQRGDWDQALGFALRSYDTGPQVGELCARNWRTIGVARNRMGDAAGEREAAQRASQCMSTRPASY